MTFKNFIKAVVVYALIAGIILAQTYGIGTFLDDIINVRGKIRRPIVDAMGWIWCGWVSLAPIAWAIVSTIKIKKHKKETA